MGHLLTVDLHRAINMKPKVIKKYPRVFIALVPNESSLKAGPKVAHMHGDMARRRLEKLMSFAITTSEATPLCAIPGSMARPSQKRVIASTGRGPHLTALPSKISRYNACWRGKVAFERTW